MWLVVPNPVIYDIGTIRGAPNAVIYDIGTTWGAPNPVIYDIGTTWGAPNPVIYDIGTTSEQACLCAYAAYAAYLASRPDPRDLGPRWTGLPNRPKLT